MYQTRQIKRAKNEQLDFLALESGRVYSKTVSLVRKLHRFKGFWISMVAVMAILKLKGYQLHSQSVQATIQAYFNALKSFFRVRKSNEDARPPFRTRKYFKVCWKSSAIRLKGNQLRLSNGKGREPVVLRLSKEVEDAPKYVEMTFQRGHYYFNLTYAVKPKTHTKTGTIVSVDLGEIHPIVSFDGEQTTIYNGRKVRSIVQYREKVKARFQTLMSRCKQRSRRWYKLRRAKNRTLDRVNAQIRDAQHKITSRFVSACLAVKAEAVVMGNLTGIRQSINYGKKTNQKLHQWAFFKIASMIEYKCAYHGIKVEYVSEAYTSQTCPQCGNRKKPNNRNYRCNHCGFEYHRDGVGAINIFNKVSEYFADSPTLLNRRRVRLNSVVGAMASPTGVRFHWHLCRLKG